MLEWLEGIAGPAYATAMLWTLGALLLLVVILLLIKVIRSLSFGTFVSGGRNRKARLAVMDAAAVDSHRRLVLVRRDDVEHLILIGGPTDVVVEQNIRMVAALRRPAEENPAQRDVRLPPDASVMTPAPVPAAIEVTKPVAQPIADAPRPVAEPTSRQPADVRPISRPQPPAGTAQPPAPAAPAPQPAPPIPARPATAVPPRAVNDQGPSLDDALLEELEVTLDRKIPAQPAPAVRPAPTSAPLPSSVEDEMSRLLGDLARPRR